MNLKNKIKVKILGYRATSESYITYLKKIGVQVGEDVVLYRPLNTTIDVQNPHLLKIGNHVMITGPVTILTHDYSWSVLKKKYGEILGNQKETVLEDNIFIGWGATILAGSHIGSNSIIGAGSIVSGKLEGDAVYAGNPAHKIMSIEDYYIKRRKKQLSEAINYVNCYKKCYGCNPSIDKLDEYFYLFFDSMDEEQRKIFDYKLNLMGNYEESLKAANGRSMFKSYEDFIEYCDNNEK
jgi:acetyltransferase-like isoleucine patch superfamily enzyme